VPWNVAVLSTCDALSHWLLICSWLKMNFPPKRQWLYPHSPGQTPERNISMLVYLSSIGLSWNSSVTNAWNPYVCNTRQRCSGEIAAWARRRNACSNCSSIRSHALSSECWQWKETSLQQPAEWTRHHHPTFVSLKTVTNSVKHCPAWHTDSRLVKKLTAFHVISRLISVLVSDGI
jgi:hypothetical protein